jgi:hypothetical protein
MEALRFFAKGRDVPYRFVVETMDLSEQQNVAVHAIGDIYKVSAYGTKVMEREITGTIPNPARDLVKILRFYDNISIRNNYGQPIHLSTGNHTTHGQIVGMNIALREGSSGSISLKFLDMGSDIEVEEEETLPGLVQKKVFEPMDRDSVNYLQFSIMSTQLDGNDSLHLHSLTSAGITMSSKYQLIDSRKHIVYYSENPVQIYGAGVITIENPEKLSGAENITRADRSIIGAKRRKIMDAIRIERSGPEAKQAMVILQDCKDRASIKATPIEILSLQATDMAEQINYMGLTFSGIGYYEDFIPNYLDESGE